MTATYMPGAPVADLVLADVAERAAKLAAGGITPGLGTILVGNDSASEGYIRMKQAKAADLGFASPHHHLPEEATQADLVAAVRSFNDDPAVDAMLVQHPIPSGLDYEAALLEMDPDKDVDGLHPVNMGRLALGMDGPVPCTPAGIEALLAFYDVTISGQEVVILGRGTTLGRPLALLLSQKRPTANAAVTVVHTGVPDWSRYTTQGQDRDRRRRGARDPPAGAPPTRRRRGRGWGPLRGEKAPARRRRQVRGGGRVDHPPRRRGGSDDRGHAVPQRHRRRRATRSPLTGGRVAPDRRPGWSGPTARGGPVPWRCGTSRPAAGGGEDVLVRVLPAQDRRPPG